MDVQPSADEISKLERMALLLVFLFILKLLAQTNNCRYIAIVGYSWLSQVHNSYVLFYHKIVERKRKGCSCVRSERDVRSRELKDSLVVIYDVHAVDMTQHHHEQTLTLTHSY